MSVMRNWRTQKYGRRLVFPNLITARARCQEFEARGYIVGIAPIGLRKIGVWHW